MVQKLPLLAERKYIIQHGHVDKLTYIYHSYSKLEKAAKEMSDATGAPVL